MIYKLEVVFSWVTGYKILPSTQARRPDGSRLITLPLHGLRVGLTLRLSGPHQFGQCLHTVRLEEANEASGSRRKKNLARLHL